VHDADSHLLESPEWLIQHAAPGTEARVEPLWMRGLGDFATRVIDATAADYADPSSRAAMENELLTRKNWWALGATRSAERSLALDLLGFRSQLVFSTHSGRSLLCPIDQPVDPEGAAPPESVHDPLRVRAEVTAHNRAMADFCGADPRLLPVGWVRLDDPEDALDAAREAIALGCAAIEVPSYPQGPNSLTHAALDPLYRLLEDAGRPLIFHLGSGGTIPNPVFRATGRPDSVDPTGNRDVSRPLRVVGLAAPVEMAVAALVFDGVLHRHPDLRVGVIEQGATWVPGFLRRLDLAARLDRTMRGAAFEAGDLPLAPSEYILRQVRFTPFSAEPLAWIIEQSDPCLYMFSSDYPHAEGGEDPMGEFDRELAGQSADVIDRFYRRNFEDLMGSALPGR
jgi:predicted TIM-barrel fold metal-dependent hydrolase